MARHVCLRVPLCVSVCLCVSLCVRACVCVCARARACPLYGAMMPIERGSSREG